MKKKVLIPAAVLSIVLIFICVVFFNKKDGTAEVTVSQTEETATTEAASVSFSELIFSTRPQVTQEATTTVNEIRDKNGKLIELTVGEARFLYSADTKTLTVSGETVVIPVVTNYWGNNVEKIVFEKGVKVIDEAFYGFKKLRTIQFSETVEEINESLFYEKKSLEKIVVSPVNKRYYTDKNGNLYDSTQNMLLRMPPLSKQSEYSLPEEITGIDRYAFEFCENLKKVNIGEKFTGSLYLVFDYCPSLEKISVNKNNPNYVSDTQGAVYNKSMTEIYAVPSNIEEFTFPSTLESVYNNINYPLTGIKTVFFPQNCDYAEEVLRAFQNLESVVVAKGNKNYLTEDGVLFSADKSQLLYYPPMKEGTSYKIPSTVTVIEDFGGKNLKIINIPDNVRFIDTAAFFNCENLELLTIGKGLEDFEDDGEFSFENENPFLNCKKLKRIVVDRGNKHFKSDIYGALYSADMKYLLTVPANSGLKEYTVPDSVVTIVSCFVNCSSIEVINFGSSVEYISVGEKDTETVVGFEGCNSLREVNVSSENAYFESVDGILYSKEFDSLDLYPPAKKGTTYSLPSNITRIVDFAFYNNKYLEKVFVHKDIKSYHYSQFACDDNGLMFDLYYEGTQEEWRHVEEYDVDHKIYYKSKGF